MSNRFLKNLLIFGVYILIILIAGCDTFLPDDFKNEEFTISDLDAKACEYISRDLFVTEITMNAISLDNFSDSLISAKFDSICGVTDTLLADTAIVVNYPEGADTSYICYNHSNSSTAYFFIGWSYTKQNINATVDIEILQRLGGLIAKKDIPFPLETIGGCYKSFVMDAETGREEIHPAIRVRNAYDLENGKYLVRIIVAKSADIPDFPLRLAIVYNQ